MLWLRGYICLVGCTNERTDFLELVLVRVIECGFMGTGKKVKLERRG